MRVFHRLPVLCAGILVALTAAPAAGEFGGPQLTIVSDVPKSVAFESDAAGGKAELGFTVRNDSQFRGALDVRIVLDGGAIVRLRGKSTDAIVDSQRIRLRLRRRGVHPLRIGPRDVARVKVQLTAEPIPSKPLTGTLVVAARRARRVSPAAAPVSFAPKAAVETASRWASARVKPTTVVVNVHRWLPSPFAPRALITDAQDVTVEGLGEAPAIEQGSREATLASEPVSADSGGRGTMLVTVPRGIEQNATKAVIHVDGRDLDRHGTYEATIPLDPNLEKSPTLTVKVPRTRPLHLAATRDPAGKRAGVVSASQRGQRRPKQVLKLALTRLEALHETSAQDTESPVPYELDPFPDGGEWDDCASPQKEAHKLYCTIGSADLKESLDDLAAEVAALDVRVRAWPIARAKVKDLQAACAQLPKRPAADKMRSRCADLSKRDPAPAGKEEANQYFGQVEEHIAAIGGWLAADAMLEEASGYYATLVELGSADPDMLRRHDPMRWMADLEAAASASDLDRCGVVAGLCRDLHLLRSYILSPSPEGHTARAVTELLTGMAIAPEARDAILAEIEPSAAGGSSSVVAVVPSEVQPAGKVTPNSSVSDRLLRNLKAEDERTFLLGFVVATITYFVTIYGDTYGSPLQYLTAFAAGAGGTYVANFKLLPWFRSYRQPSA